MTRDEATEIIVQALPYAQHIHDWDTSNEGTVRFTWRRDRFRLDLTSLSVEQVEDGFLSGSNEAILVESLIKRQVISREIKKR